MSDMLVYRSDFQTKHLLADNILVAGAGRYLDPG
jgi:hypothetical protein